MNQNNKRINYKSLHKKKVQVYYWTVIIEEVRNPELPTPCLSDLRYLQRKCRSQRNL